MQQINLNNVDWQKVTLIGLVLIAFSCLFLKCSNEENNRTAIALDKKKIEKAQQENISLIHNIDLLKSREQKFNDTISFLDKQNQSHVTDILNLSKQIIVKQAEIKRYSSSDIANYFKDNYNVPEAVKTTSEGTCLKDTVSRLVINDIVAGQGAKAELKITRNILGNTNKIVSSKDSLLNLKQGQINNFGQILSKRDTIDAFKDNMLKNTQSIVSKERLQKNIWKIATIGLAGLLAKMIILK